MKPKFAICVILVGLAILSCLLPASTYARERVEHNLQSEFLDQPRTFTVDLPESYGDGSDFAYPVLYLLDGESNLDHAVAVVDFLAESALIPETIVIGVDAGSTRASDYLPAVGDKDTGRADHFLDFMEHELLGYVEENYRAAPLRLLSGHSYGGVFVTYAMTRRPALFRAYLAQSPYVDARFGTPLVDALGNRLRGGEPMSVFYFATLGDEPDLVTQYERMQNAVQTAHVDGFSGFAVREPGATHMSTRLVGLHDALIRYFGSVWPIQTASLEDAGAPTLREHLEMLTKEYDYQVRYNEAAFQRVVQTLLSRRRIPGAVDAASLYTEQYPESPIAHFLLGSAQASGGQRDAGISAIERAMEIYDAQPTDELALLRSQMERVLTALRSR